MMKHLTTLFALIASCSVFGQTNQEFNPDFDGNGYIGIDDILGVLSHFDSPWPAPPAWSCGDLVSYQGYDYATVLIGEQCWFAENLRNENYENGDDIPSNLSDSDWINTLSGAVAVYGDGSSTCNDDNSPDSACDESWSLNQYGRLYNYYAVNDARGLCPSGWHVPTDGEWMTMEMALGMSESEANSTGGRGTDQDTQLKTDYGWDYDGNGTNSSGFSALPGGFRRDYNGSFVVAGFGG